MQRHLPVNSAALIVLRVLLATSVTLPAEREEIFCCRASDYGDRRYIGGMAKVVITKLHGATARDVDTKVSSVKRKRVIDVLGSKMISTVDAGGANFGDDLTLVFTRNVARARQENKRVTGALDRVPAKA